MSICIVCRGEGKLLEPGRDPVICDICQGFGGFDPEHMCACGRPARVKDEEYYFCGRKECLIALRRQDITRTYGHFGYRGPMN